MLSLSLLVLASLATSSHAAAVAVRTEKGKMTSQVLADGSTDVWNLQEGRRFIIDASASVSHNSVSTYHAQDPLSNIALSHPGAQARTVLDEKNCKYFSGGGFACKLESPEHTLVRKWLPANATVMEFGARFGTTSCSISNKLGNSGKQVAIEPDQAVWKNLQTNLKTNDCHTHVLEGALGSKPVKILGSGYGGRSTMSGLGGTTVPTVTFDHVEQATGLKFDTLVIDCEGCAQDIMDQIEPKMKTQINMILLEADMPDTPGSDCNAHCMNYPKFFTFLEENGFKQVDKINDCDRAKTGAPPGGWCGGWIDHYAFIRHR